MTDFSTKKYIRLKRDLLSFTAKNEMRKGDQLPSEAEIAKIFSVSEITVRRTLRELSEAGIVERLQGKGTFLKKCINAKDAAVGNILFGMFGEQPVSLEFTEMSRKECEAHGYAMRLIWIKKHERSEFIEAARNSDGILVTGLIDKEASTIIEAIDTPYVAVGNTLAKLNTIHVEYDWNMAATMMTDSFIAQGARKIAFVNAPQTYAPALICEKAFLRVCDKHGLTFNKDNIARMDKDEWKSVIPQFFSNRPVSDFDAIICEYGIYSYLIEYLYAHGVRMGSLKLGVLSDRANLNIYYSDLTCSIFKENIAQKSVEVLLKKMSGESFKQNVLLRPEIVSLKLHGA